MFGLVGASIAAGITASKQMKNKVCYLIDLHNAYYAEKDKNRRRLASRVIPILEKAGIIE